MGIFATANYPFTNTHNSYSWDDRDEGSCTKYVFNRTSYVFGGKPCVTSYGNASGWMDPSDTTIGVGWERRWGAPTAGDVAVFVEKGGTPGSDATPGHVVFCETSSVISQSNVRYPGGDGSWDTSIYHAGRFSCIGKSASSLPSGYLGMDYLGCLHFTNGSPDPGGGDDPDNPPGPDYIWVPGYYETLTTTVTDGYTYDDIIECGAGPLFADDSGDQDNPKAPTKISQSSSRINQRWEPFNMYTYERTLTYNQNDSTKWSEWELRDQGSENFELGGQPSYENGWTMEWDDER